MSNTHLTPSAFVQKHATFLIGNIDGPIADVACGSGRNLVPFAKLGIPIYAYDLTPTKVEAFIEDLHPRKLQVYAADLRCPSFRFPLDFFSLIINIHFFDPLLFEMFYGALRVGGFLLFETVDNRGGNYLEMPACEEVRNRLSKKFDIVDIHTTCVADTGREKVKVLARKNPSGAF